MIDIVVLKRRGANMIGERFVKSSGTGKLRLLRRRDRLCSREDKEA